MGEELKVGREDLFRRLVLVVKWAESRWQRLRSEWVVVGSE